MIKNKKGLSTVVTTLIIILLVLVAVGIIWSVVNNLLNKSRDTIESSTKCLDLEIRANKVVEYAYINSTGDMLGGNYNVTLQRTSSGDDEAIYAKVVLFSSVGNTAVLEFPSALFPLETQTNTISSEDTGNFTDANKVEVTAFYVDDSGNDQLCPSGTTIYTF